MIEYVCIFIRLRDHCQIVKRYQCVVCTKCFESENVKRKLHCLCSISFRFRWVLLHFRNFVVCVSKCQRCSFIPNRETIEPLIALTQHFIHLFIITNCDSSAQQLPITDSFIFVFRFLASFAFIFSRILSISFSILSILLYRLRACNFYFLRSNAVDCRQRSSFYSVEIYAW